MGSIPSAATYRELLDRVVAGRLFKRSARQRELLEFLVAQATAVPPREQHEQDIGVAIFGRDRDYDTSQDNIVRVHVSELRKKLEEYFRTEGQNEPYVLEIPRGGYNLVARPRAPEQVPEPPPRKSRDRLVFGSIAAVLAVVCIVLIVRVASLQEQLSPQATAGSALWRQFFAAGREADLIVADSCLSLFADMVHEPVTLQDYVNRTYLLNSIAPERNAERRRQLELLMTRRYTSMADVLTVQRIVSRSTLDRKNVTIHFARDYPSPRLRTMNVILLGSKRSNPWVEAFEGQMNFHMDYDPATGDNVVRNLRPGPGESSRYVIPGGTSDPRESLAVVAYLPNAEGNGGVVILAGAGLQGTSAAGEAFVSPAFERIAARLPKGNRIPHFEALLRTAAVGPAVQNFNVVALRVLP